MDDRLAAVFAAQGGVASSADAARLGIRAVQLDALVRSRRLVRVRRGAYVLKEAHDHADVWERYRLRTKAVLRTRPPVDAASHHAALMLHAVDTFDVDLSVVDVIAAVNATRLRSGLRTHPGIGLVADRARGYNVVGVPLALCQVAGGSGVLSAVCSMDDALHDRRCTRAELEDAVAHLPEHQQDPALRAIALTDSDSESVGETRTRVMLRDLGFSVEPQKTLRRGRAFVARVDFLVEGVVAVEFDGLVKYEGLGGKAALAAEKARESAIVDLGYEVVRLVWADLADPAEVARRIRAARTRALNRRRAASAPLDSRR